MNRAYAWLTRSLVFAVLGAALVMAGCSDQSVKSQIQSEKLAKGFSTVVKARKSGQFSLDGAVLAPADLGSHFAYLRDQGELPKRVLLLRSYKTSIHKAHLEAMARMSLDYGFTVYYDHDGELRRIKATQKDAARTLKGSPKHSMLPNRLNDHDAAGNRDPYSAAGG